MFNFKGVYFNLTKREENHLNELISLSENIIIKKDESLCTHKRYDIYSVSVVINSKCNFKFNVKVDNYINRIISFKDIENNCKLSYTDIVDGVFLMKNEEFRKKLDVLKCKNNICPMCGATMIEESVFINIFSRLECLNSCYRITNNNLFSSNKISIGAVLLNDIYINVGERDFSLQKRIEIVEESYEKILYWKENDRYLTKLLQK
ncbi:gp448 [Bacillus phage G]|uniref:Gp448 n=1 Tax=Bacillus phage G TaxID=2884420 RepID=G3MAI9_9CAUD|nr:gp448 [Bacillus phage G]AEO93706.1 gp448 [Bacillus phage G]